MGQWLARIAAELLQVSGVRLHHDQSLYKEPSDLVALSRSDWKRHLADTLRCAASQARLVLTRSGARASGRQAV
jgi:hypothetical protein